MTSSPNSVASDVEEIELYPEPQLTRCSKGEVNNWINVSIKEEIERGNTIRETKTKSLRPKTGGPKIIRLKNPRSGRKLRKRQTLKNSNDTSLCGCSNWPIPSKLGTMLSSNTYCHNKNIRSHSKAQYLKICSMRAAALAVPSKRHCLETWRTQSHILPDYMVDRLRQHVLDQRPVIQITDAIHCFQKRKYRTYKKTASKPGDKLTNTWTRPSCANTLTLSVLFAKKIMQKLSKPMNITLNSDLIKIYRIVSFDLMQMTKCKVINRKEQKEKYKSINDVSKKVTIWIAGILEQLEFKLLEEDLLELEEKEGPALDFIDDVVDKVLDICIPIPSPAHMEESHQDSSSSVESVESPKEELRQNSVHELTDNDHFKNEIINIIDKFDQESEIPTLTNIEYFQNEINNVVELLFKEHKIKLSDTEYFENEIYDILSLVWKESADNINELNEVDDVSEIASQDSDRSKKVMFSVLDMAQHSSHTESIRKVNGHNKNHEHDPSKRIYFAEPNEHLLSNADELWPQDILSHHVLRPSASVTKSIISLGNLWEKDEKYMTPSQTDASVTDLENTDESNLKDLEILKSITSLAKMLHDNEILKSMTSLDIISSSNKASIDVTGKSNLLKDIELLKSMTSLAKVYHGGEHLLNEASIAGKLNLIYSESRANISKSILSIVHILQDGENDWIPNEANAIIAEILNQLTDNLPTVDVTKSIATLINVLRSNQAFVTAAEASNIDIIDKLTSLNDELKQNLEVTKSIESLVHMMENDEHHIKTTDNISQQDLTIQDFLAPFIIDKCDKFSQTDKLKTLEVVVLEATSIDDVDTNKLIDNKVNKTVPVQEKAKAKVANVKNDVKNKMKTKGKGIVTDLFKKSELDNEWKVNLESAPSWIVQTNAHGEPSEDSGPILAKTMVNLTQSDLRKWCKDLDKGYKNLEIWQDWLCNTCKEATSLVKKKNGCSCWYHKHTKNWLKLRNNVAKDAALWHKMNQHTHDTFKCFKKCYVNTEVKPAKTKSKCACKSKYYITKYRKM